MNIVLIEDELPASRRLAKMIVEVRPESNIITTLDSIAATKEWFALNAAPDLVFCDIHLADGSAFEMLGTLDISSPIIFTTAYDKYALDAFKTNSIAYLLKPIKKEELAQAIEKVENLGRHFNKGKPITMSEEPATVLRSRFIIRFGEYIKTLMTEDIAYCFSEHKSTYAKTHDGRTFPMDHNLEALQEMLDPKQFFRINRRYLANIKAISEMKTHTKARVMVQFNPQVTEPQVVSSERSAEFKQWLADKR